MFEITGDDIALLNDTDLRTLIGRLCEADLRRRGHSTSYVTWGGNQTAKDGGLDVYVALPSGGAIDGYIPRVQTGFQVKKPDMPKAQILKEMKPEGILRPAIADLAKASGAYVIVSSTGSTAHSALTARKKAMAEAMKGVAAGANLTTDFYDRNRIATWVRDHPGIIPWVRERIGKALQGWQSFGSWSHAPVGSDSAYLFDDHARIATGRAGEEQGIGAIAGIDRIRDLLRQPGKSVRLVGLSGVGKTRLCEALFDENIGTASLDPSLAVYTNEADTPNPPPTALVSDLNAGQTRAILIVDNCPAALHQRLTELVTAAGSHISLITVEYDIREDQAEGTDVFSLETSSTGVIEKLVERRYPAISQVNAYTIAERSGGNARLALALAATVGNHESISGLTDAELFRRLFQQRHEHDPDLLAIAQVCSLVYSFEGVKTEGDDAELPVLAGLAGKSVQDVHKGIAELKRRDLLQERSQWRAVLPHAVANRLAVLALQNILPAAIKAALITEAPVRLLRSFSKRLGYLDTSKEAKTIVEEWLAPGGLLADVPDLDEDGCAMLANVAPVSPEAALVAIERSLGNADEETLRASVHVCDLLRSLAYDPAHFERAADLLVSLARANGEADDTKGDNHPTKVVASLFQIVLSGTLAPLEARLRILKRLLQSRDAAERSIGTAALRAMLTSDHFYSSHSFEFGSRSRDYGYHPRTGKDVKDWFEAVLAAALPIALSDAAIAASVRAIIAGAFRGLWMSGAADVLEKLSQQFAAKGFWREGWIGARRTRLYNGEVLPPDNRARLAAIEELLRPKDLLDRVRGVVTGSGSGQIDFDEIDDTEDNDIGTRMARASAAVERLGKDIAADPCALMTVLPDLLKGGSRVWLFGKGLGTAADDPLALWPTLTKAFAASMQPEATVIAGFIKGVQERDPTLADTLLDDALEHLSLGTQFVELQASVPIDEKGLKRLHRALELGHAHITQFYRLAYGRVSDVIPSASLRELLLAIASKPDGNRVAIEILSFRILRDDTAKQPHAPEDLQAGRELLATFQFYKRDQRTSREDHELGSIAACALQGEQGVPIVRHLVRTIVAAIMNHEISIGDPDDLLTALMRVHPTVVLDEVCSDDDVANARIAHMFSGLLRFDKCPLDVVPDETLLAWCDRDPNKRYEWMAASATLFKRPSEKEPHQWTSLTGKLLAKAPDRHVVFAGIVDRLRPMSWSGSLATKLEGRLRLLEQISIDGIAELADDLDAAKRALERQIRIERDREAAEDRFANARFE